VVIKEKIKYHQVLANYFVVKSLYLDEAKKMPNNRKLVEQPFQQICGEKWEALEKTLTDLSFIEAKCNANMSDDLIKDYQNSLKYNDLPAIRRRIIKDFQDFFKEQSHILQVYPFLTFQQAINQPNASGPYIMAKKAIEASAVDCSWFELKNKQQTPSSTIFTRKIDSDYVSTCAVSPDGHKIASQSKDNNITIWNSETGATLFELKGHNSWVTCCRFTTKGDLIISSSQDSTIKIWDAKKGVLLRTLKGPGPIREFKIFPDGKKIITVFHNEKSIQIWDLWNGTLLKTFSASFGQPHSCDISPDGSWIIVGSDHYPEDKYILHLLNSKTGVVNKSFEAHLNSINSCCFFPNGRKLVSTSYDETVKVWNVSDGSLIMALEGHSESVNSCAVSPDGKLIITASDDHSLKLWNATSGKLISTFKGHSGEVAACSFFPDGKKFITASRDQTIKVCDVDGNPHAEIIDNRIKKYLISGRMIIALTCDNFIKIWDSESGNLVDTYSEDIVPVEAIESSSDHKRILTITNKLNDTNTILTVWDVLTSKPISTIYEDRRPWSISFSPDGSRIVTKGKDNDTLKVWNTAIGDIGQVIKVGDYSADFAFFSDGNRILLAYDKSPLKKNLPFQIWDLNTGSLEKTLTDPPGKIDVISISPNGNRVVASCNTPDLEINTINVWDTNSGSILEPFKKDYLKIAKLSSAGSFIVDNEFLIVSCLDKTTKLFDINTGVLLFSLKGQSPFKLFPDRKKIALSTGCGTLQIWNIKDGSLAGECKSSSNGIYSLEISPAGKEILASYDDNTLILWDAGLCQKLATFVAEVPILDISINSIETIIARDSGNNLSILSLKNSNSFQFIPEIQIKTETENLEVKIKKDPETSTDEYLCRKCGGKGMYSGQFFGSFLFYSLLIILCVWLLHYSKWWLILTVPVGMFSFFSIIVIISGLISGSRKCEKCRRTIYFLIKAPATSHN